MLHGKRGSNTISISLLLTMLDNQPFVLSCPRFLNNILSEIRPTKRSCNSLSNVNKVVSSVSLRHTELLGIGIACRHARKGIYFFQFRYDTLKSSDFHQQFFIFSFQFLIFSLYIIR